MLRGICTLCLLVGLFLSAVQSQTTYPDHDCYRFGEECQNGFDCTGDPLGSCNCDTITRGHDCSVPATKTCTDATDCTGATGSLCIDATNCLCPPSHYSPAADATNCAYERHSVYCHQDAGGVDTMYINVNPQNFDLTTWKVTSTADPTNCNEGGSIGAATVPAEVNGAGWLGAIFAVPTTGTCAASNPVPADGYCVSYEVRRADNVMTTPKDYTVTFCCQSFGSVLGDVNVEVNFDSIVLDTNTDLTSSLITENPRGLEYAVYESDGISPAATNQDFGKSLILRITLPPGDNRDLMAHTCTVGPTLADRADYAIVNNVGCRTPINVVTRVTWDDGDTGTPDRPTYDVHFYVVSFTGSTEMYLACLAKICADGDTACEACPPTVRRKREVSSNNTEGLVITRIKLSSPFEEDNCNDSDSDDQVQNMTFLASVISLGAVILLLLIVIACLFVCVINKRRNDSHKPTS